MHPCRPTQGTHRGSHSQPSTARHTHRVFIYEEGLVRLCTSDYARPCAANLGDSFMHLTNYAINKHNAAAYVRAGEAGTAGETGAAGEAGCGGCGQEGGCANDHGATAAWAASLRGGPPMPDGQQEEPGSGSSSGGAAAATTGVASKWSLAQLRHYLENEGERASCHYTAHRTHPSKCQPPDLRTHLPACVAFCLPLLKKETVLMPKPCFFLHRP